MKITGVEIWPVSIPYKRSYPTALGTAYMGKHVILKLFTDEGITGAGEATYIIPERQGETQESMTGFIRDYYAPLLLGEDPLSMERVMAKLDQVTCGGYGALGSKCAVDNALWDIAGKAFNAPVYSLLGGPFRKEITVSRSLTLAPPAEVARDAEAKRAMGYRLLTLKGCSDYEADIARVRATREALGPDFPIEVDPNGAYWSGIAVKVIRRMERYDIESVEQPCPWYDLEGMAEVTRAVDTPIIADESVMTEVDALRVANMRAANLMTIKLAKCGGIFHSRKILAIAEAAGLYCNMGSMHTFGVGTAAIHHFAASFERVQLPIGYGSPLERFADDIIEEEIPYKDGVALPMEGPGLGVTLDDAKLRKYVVGGPIRVE